MDYHSISPEPLAAMPVPAEMHPFRMAYFIAHYLENKACQLLRQTWSDDAGDYYIQYTHIHILSPCSLYAIPAREHIPASIIYQLKGDIAVREREAGKPQPRKEGDFYLRRVQTVNSRFILDFAQTGTYQIVYISISEKKLAALRQSEPIFRDQDILGARDIRQAGSWIKFRIEEMQHRRGYNKDALTRYLIRRIQSLFDAFIHLYDSSTIRWRELKPTERMDHLQVYIQNNPGANLTLPALAEMLHMDKDALRKMFRQVTGVSISTFIQQARIKKACRLLDVTPPKSMEQIAEEVGYYSLDGFYYAFEAQVGCTPKRYRGRKN